ncbi:MAG TPA: type II toxin-antitoxin system VapC family toxin [Pyrinomonadaceae bacterium]
MSAVVVQELAAGALDKSELQSWNAVRLAYEKQGRLLVPTGEDCWLAGKVLNSLLRGRKARTGKRATRTSKAEQQRILRDVLIARTARRAGAWVVTDNVSDFEKIRPFCNVRVITPAKFPVR